MRAANSAIALWLQASPLVGRVAGHGALVSPQEVYGMIYRWGADMLIRDWGSGYYTLKHG